MPDASMFSVDIKQLVTAVTTAESLMDRFNLTMEQATKVTARYNEAGKIVGGVVKMQVSEFEDLFVNVKKIDGVFVALKSTLKAVASQSNSAVTSTEQLDAAVKVLTDQFKKLDPTITSVNVKNAKFDESLKLVGGTAVGVGGKMGLLTGRFQANLGAVEALTFSYRKYREELDKVAAKGGTGGGGAFPTPGAPVAFGAQGRGGGGAFPTPAAPIPFSAQGAGGGGAFPRPNAPIVGLNVPPDQLRNQAQSLLSVFQKLDPTITSVAVKTADYNSKNQLLGGTVTATSSTLGKLSTSFTTANGSIEAGNISIAANTVKMKEAEKHSGIFANSMNRLWGTFQRFVEYRAFNNITQGLYEGVRAAKDLQIQVSLIRTISQERQQTPGKFTADIRSVSDTSGIDINEIAKGFYNTVSNQIAKGADVAPFVKTATDLARVTGSELPDAVNLLSSRINAYGLAVSDADKLSAQFFRTIDEGRVVAKEMASTLGRVDVIAHNLGITSEEVNSVIAITTQKGFKTADAMTLLTNLMIKLEKPTEATAGFFQSLGVSSGEAAIKAYGFTGVLQKMVDAVNSGKISVSAFFDEIRGRKQFGIFEQSIGEIDTFTKKLQDMEGTKKLFEAAKGIRGESPADQLVIEANKLKNAFTVDLGQGLLKFTADTIKAIGGVEGLTNAASKLVDAVEFAAATLAVYGVKALLVAGYNKLLALGQAEAALAAAAQSEASLAAALGVTAQGTAATTAAVANNGLRTALVGAGVAAKGLIVALTPLALFTAGYIAYKQLFGEGPEYVWDNSAIDATISRVTKLREEAEKLKAAGGKAAGPNSLDVFTKATSDTYKSILNITAKLTIANDAALEKIKVKAKDAADNVKLFFTSYAQGMQAQLNAASSAISQTATKIEQSKKSLEGFLEKSDEAAFNFKLEFATGADAGGQYTQKLDYLEQRKRELVDKSDALYTKGTEEAVQEARKVNDEITTTLVAIAKERAALQRLGFESGLQSGVIPQAQQGPNVFVPDLGKFNDARQAEKDRVRERELLERRDLNSQHEGAKVEKKILQDRIAAFKQAQKEFEALSPFTSTGTIRPEFMTDKKFDQGKYMAKVSEASKKVLATVPEDERKEFEQSIFQYKIALIEQAGVVQRQEDLKTHQAQVTNAAEIAERRIADIKKEREEILKRQDEMRKALGARGTELSGFAAQAITGGIGEESTARINRNLLIAQNAAKYALDNPLMREGIQTLDPKLVEQAYNAYKNTANLIQQIRDKEIPSTALTIKGKSGIGTLGPGEAIGDFQNELEQLKKNQDALTRNLHKEGSEKSLLEIQLGKPLAQLKEDFPALANDASDAFGKINKEAKGLAADGLGDIRKQYESIIELNNQLKLPAAPAPIPKANIDSMIGGDVTYAATGGIVGLFPGQPRGMDRYPIWAAAGERILSAETSRLYRPLLDAIAARTAPRYMAAGGIVGDQTVGDVTNNITVNGGATNSETGRVIGNTIERLIRRRQLRLK